MREQLTITHDVMPATPVVPVRMRAAASAAAPDIVVLPVTGPVRCSVP